MKVKKWNIWQNVLTNMSGLVSCIKSTADPQVVIEMYPSLRQNVGY